MHADVAHEDRVLGERAIYLVRGALRVDGRAFVLEARSDQRLPFLAVAHDGIEPLFARGSALAESLARVEFGEHLAQEGAYVRHQAERDRIVARDLLGIDVDVDELRRRDREGIAGEPGARRTVVEA